MHEQPRALPPVLTPMKYVDTTRRKEPGWDMPRNGCEDAIDVWVERCLRRRYQAVLSEALPAELLALTDRASLSRPARTTES